MSKQPYSRGFNIIELMITVALVGIVALIAIPNLTTLVENQRVRAAANDLATAVSLARSEAVRDAANMRVLARDDGGLDFDNGWCVVNTNDNCTNNSVVRLYDPPGNVTVAVQDVGGSQVEFDRQGARVANNTPRFTFRPPNCAAGQPRARQVDIRPSGRPMVTEVDC
ncbi:MAG: GspH/FimT family pseudopilin [Natronospirillum sp.]|uniref:GspH/FimT family pseudopilin n=1 Tax=Natronospirillum sp. TaxID=2812955 RepID=UPI0025D3AB42|nr:GspH/FimT family pseudopilin [Natronospirillum sp.]MCH8550504.1 GspH/FimT family pseudopilin [Natronospirillum sp.]